jgi:hypothetical protein
MEHHTVGWFVSDDMEMMWKEVVTAYFKVLFQHLSGETYKTRTAVLQAKIQTKSPQPQNMKMEY